MPNIFDITPATFAVQLDAQGRGEVVYTVSNKSESPLRGRAVAVALGATQSAWLQVEGDAEHDFAVDGTHPYTVRVAVPAGNPPGQYDVRLLVASVANPQEEFTEGQTVSFELLPPDKAKKLTQPIQWLRVLLSAFLAAVISLAIITIGMFVIAGNPPRASGASGNPVGTAIGEIIALIFTLILWAMLYFPLAVGLSALLTTLLVQYRRMIHTLLSVAFSIPIALLFLWLINLLTGK